MQYSLHYLYAFFSLFHHRLLAHTSLPRSLITIIINGTAPTSSEEWVNPARWKPWKKSTAKQRETPTLCKRSVGWRRAPSNNRCEGADPTEEYFLSSYAILFAGLFFSPLQSLSVLD